MARRWGIAVTVMLVAGMLAPSGVSAVDLTIRGRRAVTPPAAHMVLSDIAVRSQLTGGGFVAPDPGPAPMDLGGAPEAVVDEPAPLASSGTSPPLDANFAALEDNNTSIPPDTHGAAGPDHLMVTLNSQVRVQTKAGTPLVTTSLAAFWAPTGVTHPFDPRVVFDAHSSRWITVAVAEARSAASSVLIGVSKTSDPTAAWSLYRIDADPNNVLWADYPTLGYDGTRVVVQANMFTTAGSFEQSQIYVLDKAGLAAGLPASYTYIFSVNIGSTQVPATVHGSAGGTMYLLNTWNAGSGALRLFSITGTPTNAVMQVGPFVSGPASSPSAPGRIDFAPQAGTAERLQTNDARIHSLVYRNGSLWASQTVFLPAGGSPTRSSIRWWEIGLTGTVKQTGIVDDPSAATFYAFPSLDVTRSGAMLLAYSRFSSGEFASAAYAVRFASDPPDSLRSEVLLKAGEGPYHKTFGGGRNRWGDYSQTAIDPGDDNTIWTIQEYAAAPVATGDGSGRWGTWWGRVVPPGIRITESDGSTIVVEGGATDDFTVRLETQPTSNVTVSATGGGNQVTMTPSQVTFTPADWSSPRTFTVRAVDDRIPEQIHTATVTVSAASTDPAYDGLRSSLVVRIIDRGDTVAPSTSFTTPDGSALVYSLHRVTGEATDDYSGILRVTVTFTSPLWTEVVQADLTCDPERLSCSWTAGVPLVPGAYTVEARSTDAYGNRDAGAEISVLVV